MTQKPARAADASPPPASPEPAAPTATPPPIDYDPKTVAREVYNDVMRGTSPHLMRGTTFETIWEKFEKDGQNVRKLAVSDAKLWPLSREQFANLVRSQLTHVRSVIVAVEARLMADKAKTLRQSVIYQMEDLTGLFGNGGFDPANGTFFEIRLEDKKVTDAREAQAVEKILTTLETILNR